MSEELKILEKGTIFNSLAPNDLKRIGSLLEKRDIQEGETLATREEKATWFFILASGTLLIAMEDGETAVLDTPGDFIGMELLSSDGEYLSSVISLTRGEVLAIKREDFISLIREDSALAETIMHQWNSFLTETLPFVEQKENQGFEYHY
ncbi:MAG: cyclic nucleotide-binding domain-containing protein [Desulfobacteraceae bacterium]|nr:cyclic nucleotide-binding domain-containing protein [Desulfobacteraceae bacterium]